MTKRQNQDDDSAQAQDDQELDYDLDQAQFEAEAEAQAGAEDQEKMLQLTADLQRVQADFINFKRQTDTQLQLAEQRGQMRATLKFLDIIDDVERALTNIPDNLKGDAWVKSLEAVYGNMQKKIADLKLNKIDALGQPFDPEFHEAVMQGDSGSDKITEVLKNGYTYDGVVVRHAMVKVG